MKSRSRLCKLRPSKWLVRWVFMCIDNSSNLPCRDILCLLLWGLLRLLKELLLMFQLRVVCSFRDCSAGIVEGSNLLLSTNPGFPTF